jgi:peptidoglycan/xylan/chitin deacetylase (PgdA/CDA1 family)
VTWRRLTRVLALYALRALGGFALARRLTRGALRILAYHGFSLMREHEWHPQLFIRGGDFERRMRHLVDKRYPVLELGQAVRALRSGTLPPRATVITIDEGFFSTYAAALPILARYRLKATLYLATYYVINDEPVFNLAVSFMLSYGRTSFIDAGDLGLPGVTGVVPIRGAAPVAHDRLVDAIVAAADDRRKRAMVLERLAELLRFDLEAFRASGILRLVDIEEARRLHAAGVGIEMHTHRHQSATTVDTARREIADNRGIITAITGRRPSHFCFPSGDHAAWADAWLAEAEIESATTTATGFNYATTHRYRLCRFLDSHRVLQIEFEAELAGVLELGRRLRSWLRGPAPVASPTPLAAADARSRAVAP